MGDESEDEKLLAQHVDPKNKPEQKRTLEIRNSKEIEGSIRSSTSSPIPSSTTSRRSSQSSIISSQCSSRAISDCEEVATTPPNIKKKVISVKRKEVMKPKNKKILSEKNPVTDKDTTTSTTTRSRSGRQNAPRFDYRTGSSKIEKNNCKNKIESKNKEQRIVTANSRKRTKKGDSRGSGTSSPELKKIAGSKVVAKNEYDMTDSSDFEIINDSSSKSVDENLTESTNSDFEVVSQPASPKSGKSSHVSSSSKTSIRSTRATRKKV